MYDDFSGGSNKLPREGVMVASHWQVPMQAEWGLVQGKRAGETVTFFRTAVHEVGHALSLDHNSFGTGIMRATDGIANESRNTPDRPFPTNIDWAFAAEDGHRLRHWPDPLVRPGGVNPRWRERTPVNAVESDIFELTATPVLTSLPLGAPVRVALRLVNTGSREDFGPAGLSLSSGTVRGEVIDPAGTVRTFAPLVVNEASHSAEAMKPGAFLEGELCLWRGAQGELFPAPGAYRIVIDAGWTVLGLDIFARAETRVAVTPAVDAAHAEAARRLFATPDTLLVLAFGGDHLSDGVEAIRAALEHPVLRPHLAYIEAKRLATRFGARQPDLQAAAALIDPTTVMSGAEAAKAKQILRNAAGR
jgi:hypothetical protein